MSWFRGQWQAFTASYDAAEAAPQSGPGSIIIGIGSLTAVLLVVGYVPSVAALSQFRAPFVPIALAALGAACSYMAYRRGATGILGSACMLADTLLYSSSLSLSAVLTSGAFQLVFAIALGLFLVGFPGKVYGLTLPIALMAAGPPVTMSLLFRPPEAVGIMMWVGSCFCLLSMHRSRARRALVAQNERLRSALGAADQVADASVDAALGVSLLNIGHLLHELRNAQACQRINLTFLLEESKLEGDCLAALRETMDAQTREEKLIAQTLADLRRFARPQVSSFAIEPLLRQVCNQSRNGLTVELPRGAPRIEIAGSEDHLRFVVENLLRNAQQAGARRVDLRLQPDPSATSVLLEVTDDGPGIEAETRARLFQPFTNGPTRQGMGLGLYLCKRYVALMGGTIWAEDGVSGGASFRMRLPAKLLPAPAGMEVHRD